MVRNRSTNKAKPVMSLVHPNAAAIDIGATMHMAAVSADRTPEPVRSFGTFTADLHRLVDWFIECGVETVVMESTGAVSGSSTTYNGAPRPSALPSNPWSRHLTMPFLRNSDDEQS